MSKHWEFEGQITINGLSESDRVSLHFPGQGHVSIRGIRAETPGLADRRTLTLYPFTPSMLCTNVGRRSPDEFSYTIAGSDVGDYQEVRNHPGDADIDVRPIQGFQVSNLLEPDDVLVRISGATLGPHKLMKGVCDAWQAPWNFVVAFRFPRTMIQELAAN